MKELPRAYGFRPARFAGPWRADWLNKDTHTHTHTNATGDLLCRNGDGNNGRYSGRGGLRSIHTLGEEVAVTGRKLNRSI